MGNDKPTRCKHVSTGGRRCIRDEWHDGAHWLDAEPVPEVPQPQPAPSTEKLPPRPEGAREIALEYREPELGRIAAAIVYLADTLKPPKDAA